jgi:AraC-like DNA-binding protein
MPQVRALPGAPFRSIEMTKEICLDPLLTEQARCRTRLPRAALIHLIVDQLETIQAVALQLPNPSDPRALRVAGALLGNPGDQRVLTEICISIGAGKRTIERRFQEETGMTLGKWRQQLRLMHAMRLLAEGAKVTHAALEAGYSTPSGFISMFRNTWGTTPKRCFGLRPQPK